MIKAVSNKLVMNCNKTSFNKVVNKTSSELLVEKFTPRSIKLIKSIDKLIEDTWCFIKKNKQFQLLPEYPISTRRFNVVVKALYRTNNEDSILFELSEKNSRVLERFIIDRKAQNYSYERSFKTAHGSATVETYNSKTGQRADIDAKLNDYIETFFPNVLVRNRKMIK